MRHILTLAAAATLALPLAAQAATPDIQPGQWTFVSVTTVEGDVDVPERKDRERQCISEDDIESADFGFVEEQEGCELLNQDIRADGLDYRMTCTADGGQADIDGAMQFMGDTIKGDVMIDTQSPVGRMTMKTHIDGNYQGECQSD
ncbi:DUF3617 domain-containing protein [Vreelandella jeotgali]|uniref:DUF3617 domain-containing protein n=1 Tax=Vreelandella jeotgali TaxID=553386 RepID=UPI00034BF2B4|nr:DUF3617 family protein [Halomonas jeotgali]